jgi:hypothetical protein
VHLVCLLPRELHVLMEHREDLLVRQDLVGERLVLLGEVEVVADLGQGVGEVRARQHRLEDRRPVGVVGLLDPCGEEGHPRIELRLLGRFLGLDLGELVVEPRRRGRDLVDGVLAARHLDRHLDDLRADGQEVRVDLGERCLRPRDLRREHLLVRRQRGDGGLLLGDELLERPLLGVGVGQRIGGHGAGPRGDEHATERRNGEEQEEEPSRRARSGGRPPAERVSRGAAHEAASS